MNRTWIAALALGLVAAVLVVFIATRTPVDDAAPTAPVVVRASFEQPVVGFGDRVRGHVVVLLDRKVAAKARVTVNVAPLAQLGPVRVTRASRGRLQTLTYEVDASCMFDDCVGRGGRKLVKLAPVRVQVPGRTTVEAAWPVLDVRGRVVAADLQPEEPPLKVDVTPPAVDYLVAPSTFAAVLTTLAVLLALGGVGLAGRQVAALRRERATRAAPLTELERALLLAREAGSRSAPDRRRALGLLERLLRSRDARLARAARDLAWSPPPPDASQLDELVADVESTVQR